MQDKDVETEEKETSASVEVSNILNLETEIMNSLRKKEVAHSERDINPKKGELKRKTATLQEQGLACSKEQRWPTLLHLLMFTWSDKQVLWVVASSVANILIFNLGAHQSQCVLPNEIIVSFSEAVYNPAFHLLWSVRDDQITATQRFQ